MKDNTTNTVIQLATLGAVVFLVIRLQQLSNTAAELQPLIDKLKSTGVLSSEYR